MLVAIYAYEQIYGGLHGMCSHTVIEVENMEEAEEYAISESVDVIGSYNEIMDDIQTDAEGYVDDFYDEDYEEALDQAMAEAIEEDVAYEIYEITKETTESLEQLNKKYYQDPEGFIKEYCQKGEY